MTTRISTRWKLAALVLLVLIGWLLSVGLGHGTGRAGTTTIELHTNP